ncbi:peptidoglycan DD-metalloendopeptidase family protein [Chondrinema litorale]|uniref:peptidoglycan DD-metalloendopeptidase family protein n=1 Tax=Chondrinema litorale TaxID=2994555 RepID=UPI002543365F|nr:peptidoglycan DD-metalloendopeptidase family protein [Chondrinema litorale]UZR98266.1 peptidoglycan DD-metalloendopeptidase family protein [Chondrinema litorale]
MYRNTFRAFIGITLVLISCNKLKEILNIYSPRQAYSSSVKKVNVFDSTLIYKWETSWDSAIYNTVSISIPYKETGYFSARAPQASSFIFDLKTGEILVIDIQSKDKLFAELFKTSGNYSDELDTERIAYFEEGDSILELEIKDAGNYIFKLQSELLSQGYYDVSIRKKPQMIFPVAGKDARAVQSYWGASRDGGVRSHEGIDIFAPKGTPVIAAVSGLASTTENKLGGKAIWIYQPQKKRSLYYAHLDSQYIKTKIVRVGDTIGTVGNTGNAKFTASHLHFGIYSTGHGPVDPLPFIDNVSIYPKEVNSNAIDLLNNKYGKVKNSANVRVGPSLKNEVDTTLRSGATVAVKAVSNDFYRVKLLNGQHGFIYHTLLTALKSEETILN